MKRSLVVLLSVALTASAFADRPAGAGAVAAARADLSGRGYNVNQLVVKDALVDDVGNTHIRFQQYVNGARVWGGDVTSHDTKGAGRMAGGTMFRGIVNGNRPTLSGDDAVAAAKNAFGGNAEIGANAELVIYPRGNGFSAQLAYAVDISNTWSNEADLDNPRREMMIIDAHNGAILDRWNNLQTASVAGTGYGYYAGTLPSLAIDLTNGSYSLYDVANNGKTYDYKNKKCSIFGCSSAGTLFISPDAIFGTNGALSNRESIGVDAHFFASKVLEYYRVTYGRNGIDNNNNKSLGFGHMVSRTHYAQSYNNAFWDGRSMTYGDGDGTTRRPFDALDVVGHEMTHGITERTSNLTYSNESGAANEAFSDIFGTVVEFYVGTVVGFGGQAFPADWWIGEDLYLSSNPASPTAAIRNMADPHISGDPCHYTERYTGTNDSGGVHTNSGIQNKVFYLLTNGGTNHKDTTGTTVTGIGLADAAAVAYDADTKFCTTNSNFAAVANAFVNAAKARFGTGSVQAQQSYNAWKACGVTPTAAP
ncbi:MAG TPA: M4 family metallopeptidase [Thermoanaerobaculia bacterium]|nr:M4 family metallopeptidase [Thermoanaerobaculia bacterium]